MDEHTARRHIDALVEYYKTEEGSNCIVDVLYAFKDIRHLPETSTAFHVRVSCLICGQPREFDWFELFGISEVVDYLLAHNKCSQKS